MGHAAIRDRLQTSLRAALRAGDKTAAAGYERVGHADQADRLRREAAVLLSALDPDRAPPPGSEENLHR